MKTHQDTAHVSCKSLSVGKNTALFFKVWGVGGGGAVEMTVTA